MWASRPAGASWSGRKASGVLGVARRGREGAEEAAAHAYEGLFKVYDILQGGHREDVAILKRVVEHHHAVDREGALVREGLVGRAVARRRLDGADARVGVTARLPEGRETLVDDVGLVVPAGHHRDAGRALEADDRGERDDDEDCEAKQMRKEAGSPALKKRRERRALSYSSSRRPCTSA